MLNPASKRLILSRQTASIAREKKELVAVKRNTLMAILPAISSHLLNELDNVKESAWHLNLKAILMIIGFGLAMRKKSQSMSLLLLKYALMKETGFMFRLITTDSVVNAIECFILFKKTANGMK